MASRMYRDESYYRVPVSIEYDIEYSNGYDPVTFKTIMSGVITHEAAEYYLGPYGSIKMAEAQKKKWIKYYQESPETYRNLSIEIGLIEEAKWVPV